MLHKNESSRLIERYLLGHVAQHGGVKLVSDERVQGHFHRTAPSGSPEPELSYTTRPSLPGDPNFPSASQCGKLI